MGYKKKHKSFKKKPSGDRTFEKDPVKAKKHLGQHFLKDEGIAKRIADTLSLEGYQNVLEIGPGTGVLTKYLLEQEIHLLALDLDTESIAYLKQFFVLEKGKDFHPKSRFQVLEADFLKEDLHTHFGQDPFAITGNFPYNISTQIVFKMLDYKEQVPEFTGMFQKEVAQRICAPHGNKTYGILSVLTQAYYKAEYLFTVPPSVFSPPPKVDSGVLRLKRRDNLDIGCDPKRFTQVVKLAFNLRRKTLRNSLKTLGLPKSLTEDTIFDRRPEQISVPEFIALVKKIEDGTV
jgi:16S rRNA (adenine1518-N6/adenine1519-N6)-dimethyltransferase